MRFGNRLSVGGEVENSEIGRFIGGQADVQVYTQKSNALLDGLGSAWIRLMSWLSYVY